MRLLFINAESPFAKQTGYHVLTRKVLDRLAKTCELHYLQLTGELIAKQDNVESRVALVPFHSGNKRMRQASSLLGKRTSHQAQIESPKITAKLLAHVDAVRPDAVLFNHIRAAWLAPMLAKELRGRGISTVYFAHNAEGKSQRSIAAYEPNVYIRLLGLADASKVARAEERIVKSVDITVALSAHDAEVFRGYIVDGSLDPFVVPPSIAAPGSAVSEEGSATGVLLIGSFLWRPKQRNALWLVKKIMPTVWKECPGISLRIVGFGAGLLRKHIHDSRIQVSENVSSVEPFLAQASIFAVPERQQGGVKLKTIEAAGFGLAIVSTPEGIQGTGLVPGESCLVADDEVEFARAILRVAGSPPLRAQLGGRARDVTVEQHSTAVFENALKELLEKLVQLTTGRDRV